MNSLLIVDDEIEILQWLKDLFSYECDRELDVYTASSGRKAIELLNHMRFDVVLTDIKMPGMDGMETCKKLRQRYPEANVFMVSSMAYDDMIDQAVKLGARGFLFKPFTKESLLEGLQGAFKAIENDGKKE